MFLLLSVSLSTDFVVEEYVVSLFSFEIISNLLVLICFFFLLLKIFASEISCSEYLMLLCMSFTCFDSQLKVIEVSILFYEVNSSRVFENFELYVRLCQFWILRAFFPCNPHLSDCMCA